MPKISLSDSALRRFTAQPFRPPAVPLIAVDPYFSIWSCRDKLTDEGTRHWTGTHHDLRGLLRVDGKTHRFLGGGFDDVPALEQKGVVVYPTRTVYTFQSPQVELTVTFLTPLLPDDLDLFSWPITYVEFAVTSRDGKPHKTAVYFDLHADISCDDGRRDVTWFRNPLDSAEVIGCGAFEQRILEKVGDDVRIDWGYLYLALPKTAGGKVVTRCQFEARTAFVRNQPFPTEDASNQPCPIVNNWPCLSALVPLDVSARGRATGHVIVAYDDLYSLEYHQRKLRPYWRRNGASMIEVLKAAVARYDEIVRRCEKFDAQVITDLDRAGGPEYAQLASLAYRQCCAAHKLAADFDGTLLYLSKENFSNGCIGTVDVTYPSSPFFLYFNPALLQAQIEPVFDYARSPRWKFSFAPHDLGVYPKANGQVYGGAEHSEEWQMPVEECGNMILLTAALAQAQDGTAFAESNWDLLTKWARYLADRGFDPEKQLCTDDFAGHLAHNANLSVKAIVALGAYAQLAAKTGRKPESKKYHRLAESMVKKWIAAAAEGNHYRLAFDAPRSWSLKYNLFWDRALKLKLFPAHVVASEWACYLKRQDKFGLPLDNRKNYGKNDWTAWWAALGATRDDFRAFIVPLREWAHTSKSRVPLTDWYFTDSGDQVTYDVWRSTLKVGFQARSVVGGYFAKLYLDRATRPK